MSYNTQELNKEALLLAVSTFPSEKEFSYSPTVVGVQVFCNYFTAPFRRWIKNCPDTPTKEIIIIAVLQQCVVCVVKAKFAAISVLTKQNKYAML